MDTSYLDWPFFEPKHRELYEALEAWAAREVPALVAQEHEDLDGTCVGLVQALGGAGFLQYAVPAAAGGLHERLDVRSLCLIRETLARHNALADFAFAMQGLGSGPISLFGTASQQERLLSVSEGSALSAFALSEPNAGSDAAAMTTLAKADGDDFVINGEKTWISNGGIANFYTVFAQTELDQGAKGVSCFVVGADNPGLEIAERIDLVAPHPLATLRFNDCRIPRDDLIGEPGRGFAIAMATLDVFRSTVGAAALGMARRALDETLAHVSEREAFGGHLADLQLVQGLLADMLLDVDSSALLVYRSAWTKDCVAERVTREAAMAKLHATEAAQRVIDAAVQLHGARGVQKGSVVEALYRDVRALRIYEGASEVQKTIIARHALG